MKIASTVTGMIGGLFAIITGIWLIDSGTLHGYQSVITTGTISVVGGSIGLVGCAIVWKSKILSGIFMVIGALVCFIADFNVISMILFILGAVFAQSEGGGRNVRRRGVPPWLSLNDEDVQNGEQDH